MSTLDLYEEGFPHGSAAGYDKGCRGIACPNHGSAEFLSCREAKTQHDSDYATGKLPPDTVLERVHPEPPAKVKAKQNTERQLRSTRGPLDIDGSDPVAAPSEPEVDPHDGMTEKQMRSHYAAGCRDQRCRDASSAAARLRVQARRAAAGDPPAKPVKVARHSYQGKPKRPKKPAPSVPLEQLGIAEQPVVFDEYYKNPDLDSNQDPIDYSVPSADALSLTFGLPDELRDPLTAANEIALAEAAGRELERELTQLALLLHEEQVAHEMTRGKLEAALAPSPSPDQLVPDRGGFSVAIAKQGDALTVTITAGS